MQRAAISLSDLEGTLLAQATLELGQKLMLGRGRQAGLRVRGELISREHLLVELDIDGLFVSDVSRNGSFLGDERLEPRLRTAVPAGATVRLGKDRLLSFTLEGVADLHPDDLPEVLRPLTEQYTFLYEAERNSRRRVYAARHRLMRRTVSVEVPAERLERGSPEEQRFVREARLFSRLDSPHLLKMYDFQVTDLRPVRIMERPQGESAAARLAHGPLPIDEVLRIAADLAQALDTLSQAGVVHRDIHPETVIVTGDGVAKLGSFGIAKPVGEGSITKTGVLLGRFGHTAPEQLDDPRGADGRSDIYALGATLYHLLTGEPPLSAKQVHMNQWQVVPARERRPDCPPEVSAWLETMLQPDSADRPQTAAEVAATARALRDTHARRAPGSAKFDPALLETQADDD